MAGGAAARIDAAQENAIKECCKEGGGAPPNVAWWCLQSTGAVCYENYMMVRGRGRHKRSREQGRAVLL